MADCRAVVPSNLGGAVGTDRIGDIERVVPDPASRVARTARGHPTGVGVLTAVQRSAGNRTLLTLLDVGQAKLDVGPVDDPYEREADHVAARVVEVLRSATPPDGQDEVTGQSLAVQRRAVSGPEGGTLDHDTEAAIGAARTGGVPLSDPVRRSMEGAFGADFGSVRVHDGPAAADLSDRVGARAFTVGNDIFFRDGSPDATTASGQQLLAHELTHTLQQMG
jgi:Domain of unknown function (DUF4157)